MSIVFNPDSCEFVDDPYPIYKRLRDEAFVFHNAERNFWALSRYEDVVVAHKDATRCLSAGGVTIEGYEAGAPLLILKDTPEHAWHKRLVMRVCTPSRMAALEPFIRKRTVEFQDAAANQREFDFVKEFAVQLPLDMIRQLLDIPPA
jgi:cytochrome P450